MTYADVIIDTKSDNVDNFFTYDAAAFPDIRPGARVRVPFGRGAGRISGYVFALRDTLPEGLEGKRISRITEVDEELSLPEGAIDVCLWMKARYYCRYIEAAQCFAPAGKPRKKEEHSGEEHSGDGSTYVSEPLSLTPAPPLTLEQQHSGDGSVYVPEPLSLAPAPPLTLEQQHSGDGSVYVPEPLSLAPAPPLTLEQQHSGDGSTYVSEPLSLTPAPPLTLEQQHSGDGSTYVSEPLSLTPAPPLTLEQQRAASAVLPKIAEREPAAFLLHGVTGSGKTEVYLAACEKTLEEGRKAIMLVPEISLTHQTVKRFVERFGEERIAILHSKMTIKERYESWLRIKKGVVDIVIGARSAVFAPFSDIGLIIVDEEHEGTYKSDMTPKYDTVEVAYKRAAASCAVLLLGSATPSVVSAYRAEQGLYKKLALTKRYNTTPLPELFVVDMRAETLKGNLSVFSEALYKAVNETLEAGRQAMLFLNRRGWSSFVSCPSCGYVMKCERCNISLTYHKAENRAVCHYCGKTRKVPDTCPSCGKPGLRFFGIGTEQVEERAKEVFPQARIARLDADNARKRGSGERILNAFGAGRTDILIGTQMIAKGLDFPGVALVGIVAADISLNIPDFKSPERTFQLITQVAGRAGRREERGRVFIQTYIPENYAIEAASGYDYEGFYRSELFFRKTLTYPPFSDVVQITSYAAEEEKAREGAERARKELLAEKDLLTLEFVLGPRPAPIVKVGNDFRYHLYVKAEIKKRRALENALGSLKQRINTDAAAGYRIIVDINPYSLM